MSATIEDNLEFLKSSGSTFGRLGDGADKLHGSRGNGHHSVTETYWFEVLVPSANLIAHVYIYMRPNLSMCSAGVYVSRGFTDHPLLMDHFNYHAALPSPKSSDDLVSVPEIGLSVKILDPLKRFEISYKPAGSADQLNLIAEAAMAPAVRVTGKHFNQFMKYTGEIQLGAERIAVNDISMRDRSWGEARLEDPNVGPVTTWASGFFADNGTAFNLIGFDDPKRGVEWAGIYDIPSEKSLLDGWYLKDGKLSKIVRMSKRSDRDPKKRMAPSRVEADFEDADGRRHTLTGRAQAACCMQAWPNIHVWLPLMKWELDGVSGWGDCQEYLWSDYAKRFWR